MIIIDNIAYYLMVTRFNNETFNENREYIRKREFSGCLYNSPCEISHKIPKSSRIIVFEMNNDMNRIMGIGYLLNKIRYNKRHDMYTDKNYNRYSYVGKYHKDRDEILRDECMMNILEEIEKILFYGKGHMKRGHGIQKIPEKKIKDKNNDISKMLKSLFLYNKI